MKNTYTKLYISAIALLVLVSPAGLALASGDAWYDSGSYYDTSWTDSGSYYDTSSWYDSGSYYSNDNSWYDSGTYYDNSWVDSGSYYDNSWVDSGTYYDNSWYDSGSYYDNSWYDSGTYYDNSWTDSGTYYDTPVWADSGSYYPPAYNEPIYVAPTYASITYPSYINQDYYGYGDNYGCGSGCYGYNYDYDYDYNYDYCDTHDCNNYDNLDVICTVSDRTINEGDSVTFTANADGGRGSYTYRWSGDVSGSGRSITKRFNTSGTYYATVRVTDRNGQSATANCGSVRVEDDRDTDRDFDVVCRVSDRRPDADERVTFTADVDGGRGSYTYQWYGDVFGSGRTIDKRFFLSGSHYVTVQVTDRYGNRATAECPVVVVDEDRSVTSGVISSGTSYYPPTGTNASVGSVYLNQVPYTGPEDVAKGIAFVVGILAWSIAGAMIIRNRMNKKAISNKVAAFKEANRTSQV